MCNGIMHHAVCHMQRAMCSVQCVVCSVLCGVCNIYCLNNNPSYQEKNKTRKMSTIFQAMYLRICFVYLPHCNHISLSNGGPSYCGITRLGRNTAMTSEGVGQTQPNIQTDGYTHIVTYRLKLPRGQMSKTFKHMNMVL